MKHLKLLSLGLTILFLTLLTLAGCGIPQADYDALLTQKTTLETEKQSLQSDYTSLQTEHTALQAQKNTLETEKQALQANYDTVNSELADIKKVYPPRDFNSRTELENWLAQNTVSEEPDVDNAEDWIGKALDIQEDALLDGYIINLDYDYDSTDDTYYVFCTTVIDGFIWYWDPETDDVYQDTDLVAVK